VHRLRAALLADVAIASCAGAPPTWCSAVGFAAPQPNLPPRPPLTLHSAGPPLAPGVRDMKKKAALVVSVCVVALTGLAVSGSVKPQVIR
jgi:hypothetical protein